MKYLVLGLSLFFALGMVSCDKMDFEKDKKQKKEIKDYDKDKKVVCFELLLSVSYSMPDGSTLNIEDKEDWTLLKDWYEENKEAEVKPTLDYPVDIKFADGTIETIDTEALMIEAKKDCK